MRRRLAIVFLLGMTVGYFARTARINADAGGPRPHGAAGVGPGSYPGLVDRATALEECCRALTTGLASCKADLEATKKDLAKTKLDKLSVGKLDSLVIVNNASGMALDVADGEKREGLYIQQYAVNGRPQQEWKILPKGP